MADPPSSPRRDELVAERDFLVRSLDDLDAERAAGDLDDAQYAALRTRYVRRAAAVARQLEGDSERATTDTAARPRRMRAGWLLAGLAIVGLVAGVALAANLGQRSNGASLSGTGPSDRAAACRAQVREDPPAAVRCYDALLATAADDPEFLTYRGWAQVRAGDPTAATADFDRAVEVEPEYPDVYVFRAVVAKGRGDFTGAQAELDRLYALDPPAALLDTAASMGLDTAIAEGLLRPEALACWKQESRAITAINSVAAGGPAAPDVDLSASLQDLIAADTCLSAALTSKPDDVDALVMRGLAISVLYQVSAAAQPDAAVLARAFQVLDRAVELAPDDPEARLVRAAVRNMSGDATGALEDLDRLGDRRISPLFASIDVATIRADVEQQLRR